MDPSADPGVQTARKHHQNTADDGVGYVYYDYDISSMGTACLYCDRSCDRSRTEVSRDRSLLRVPAYVDVLWSGDEVTAD